MTRSSDGTGLPRPSRLLVVIHSDPSGALRTVRTARAASTSSSEPGNVTTPIRGHVLGRHLYDELLARLTEAGIHTVVALVALPNPGSVALTLRPPVPQRRTTRASSQR